MHQAPIKNPRKPVLVTRVIGPHGFNSTEGEDLSTEPNTISIDLGPPKDTGTVVVAETQENKDA
jgi:hypothetical protein